jgi:hypothetical protein
MNRLSFARKSFLFAVVLAPLAAAAAEASASQAGYARVFEPGIACRTIPNAGWGANWSNLGNWTGSTQTAWCPLLESDGQLDLHVDVTPGWATLGSCYVAFMSNPTQGFWYNPAQLDHQSGGYDTVDFTTASIPTTTPVGEVQCNIPNGQMIMDYNQNTRIFFNATSW